MKYLTLSLLSLYVFTASCDRALLGEDETFRTAEENLQPPPALNDGWDVSSMEAENIIVGPIENAIRSVHQNPRRMHSILLIKNNKLVLECYFEGWHRDRLQSLRSVSKSFASTLIGIAIDKKFISNVEEPLYTFFPEYADLMTEEKKHIRLNHVLSMTSGFEWDQFDSKAENDESKISSADDALQYVLEKDLVSTPGKNFLYNSGNSDLLLGIVHNSTGMQVDQFAEEHLFTPLGITDYAWITHRSGFFNAGWGLSLKPRDMAKLGQLFLDSGQWKGQQIVSRDWVKRATSKSITANQWQDYGFQWWLQDRPAKQGRTFRTYYAAGNGGQVIMVVPELNAVAVFTGGNYSSREGQLPYSLFDSFILNALF